MKTLFIPTSKVGTVLAGTTEPYISGGSRRSRPKLGDPVLVDGSVRLDHTAAGMRLTSGKSDQALPYNPTDFALNAAMSGSVRGNALRYACGLSAA